MYQFLANNPVIRYMRTDNSFRLELDVPESEYNNFIGLSHPNVKGKNLRVFIVEDGTQDDIIDGIDKKDAINANKEEKDDDIDDMFDIPPSSEYKKSMAYLNIYIDKWCEKNKKTREEYKDILRNEGLIEKSLKEIDSPDVLRSIADGIRLELEHNI